MKIKKIAVVMVLLIALLIGSIVPVVACTIPASTSVSGINSETHFRNGSASTTAFNPPASYNMTRNIFNFDHSGNLSQTSVTRGEWSPWESPGGVSGFPLTRSRSITGSFSGTIFSSSCRGVT